MLMKGKGPNTRVHNQLKRRITSINQSKFTFQVITENYNVINAIALEGLPEKHYAH